MGDVTRRAIVQNIDGSRAINVEATVDCQIYNMTLYIVGWLII